MSSKMLASARTLLVAWVVAGGAAGCASAPEEVPSRVRLVNQALALTSASGAGEASSTFTYVGDVAVPEASDGRRVQATNFAFDGDHAYVVYNTAGAEVLGAFDVFDLSDVASPKLVSSRVLEDFELADVQVKDGYAYAVGQDRDHRATLQVIDVHDPRAPRVAAGLRFDAHYATSVLLEGPHVFVTTGTNGGLVEVDVSDPERPAIVTSAAIPNALSVVRMEGANLVLGGQGSLAMYREKDGDLSSIATIADGYVEAPGRTARRDHRLFTSAGKTGLTVIDVAADGRTATVSSRAAIEGTGNGADASSQHLFLAQGEAGTHVYRLHGNDAPVALGKFEFPEEADSSNQVRYANVRGKGYLFVGIGLGGFHVVSFDER